LILPTDGGEGAPGFAPDPTRWRLDVRYDGAGFAGWAAQPDQRTVQGELQLWLSRLLGLDGRIRLVCAGRTDAGVHARGQVAHLDLPADAIPDEGEHFWLRLRRALPDDLAVTSLGRAPVGFDARFAAIWRRYCYRVADADTPIDPLLRSQVVRLDRRLDLEKVNTAAGAVLGLRDFAAFCRHRPDATTIRTLLELTAVRASAGQLAGVVEFTVRADAFCHSMVRSLVGALVEVGSGRRSRGWLEELTSAQQRQSSVPVLPAGGLTLEEVGYPPPGQLAERVRAARARRERSGD
jgi:tRNA pseudouridine38-40 synthase